MYWRCCLVGIAMVLHATTAFAARDPLQVDLVAYGPGGPFQALRKCAELYQQRSGRMVGVLKAKPFELKKRVQEDGDIFYTGAEYMLDEFVEENPGVLDLPTARKLYPRRVGILVRKGNPMEITGPRSLQSDEVKLMTATLENMESFVSLRGASPTNLRQWVYTGFEGARTWLASTEIDAWITYQSWHVWLDDESEFIALTDDRALRYTMAALTRRTQKRQMALEFLEFLKSPDAQRIFEEHGWEP